MNKIGLVLSGEGGKSTYHLGIWKAIKEWDMVNDISAVAGTSTGILNAIMFALDDYETAKNIWLSIKPRDVMKLDSNLIIKRFPSELYKKYTSTNVFLESSIRDTLNYYLNADALRRSKKNVYACVYNKTKNCSDYFLLNNLSKSEIVEIVIAGMSLPGVQADHYINKCVCYDCGIKPDISLKSFSENNPEIDSVIICHCNEALQVSSEYDNIIEISPHDNDLFNDNLNFSSNGTTKRIRKGYNDAMRMFDLVFRGMAD